MGRGSIAIRAAALLGVAALALHELNGLAGGAPSGHGHSYLPLAAALVTVLLLLACVRFAHELWHASHGRVARAPRLSFGALWPTAALALLMTFVLQEWIEGWVTPGHSAAISHAVAHVGWLTPLLALGFGALIALLVKGSRAAVVLLASRFCSRPRRVARGRWTTDRPAHAPRVTVLAANRAGRAPPVTSFS